MINRNFHTTSSPRKISEIADIINCEISKKDVDVIIQDIKPLEEAGTGDLTFLSNKKYLGQFKNTTATACIVALDFTEDLRNDLILLKVKNPYFAYAQAIDLFYTSAKKYVPEIKQSAYISASARIGNGCYIGHNVVIEDNVVIGDNCVIESGTIIDYGVKIGNRAVIYSSVSISHSIIGDDVVILSGARIGQDGFGFATNDGVHHKIYHTGKVLIGNDVEIGANTTIDRGSMNDTVIEDLCRIDNLVQIGHNVRIGRGSIIVAQVGIAGSSTIGQYCALGGQVGVAGHITIADKVQLSGQAGVIQDIKDVGVVLGGTPAIPIKDWLKQGIIMKKLTRDK